MKRILLALALALLASISLSVSVANASHNNGRGPNKDMLVGTGKRVLGSTTEYIHINAQSGPAGENPRGHFTWRTNHSAFGEADLMGEVTCLLVRDNRAVVLGVGERNKVDNLNVFGLIWIDDNGEGNEPNDTLAYVFIGRLVPFDPGDTPPCRQLMNSSPPVFDVHPSAVFAHGNFIVHDAKP